MFKECRHILTSGRKCKGPALNGAAFCHFHTRLHRPAIRCLAGSMDSIEIPDLEDRCAIQFVLAQVLRHLVLGHIDRFRAIALLNGLKLAAQLIDRKILAIHPREAVSESTQSPEGDDLGPAQITCDDDESCVDCPLEKICPNYDPENTGDDGEDDGETGHLDPKLVLAALNHNFHSCT